MAYITAYYDWSTGDTITAARLDGNINNLLSALNDGSYDHNASAFFLGSTSVLNSSRELENITKLTVDNLVVNGNTISSSSGAINIVPLAGQVLLLDTSWQIDDGVITAVTDKNYSINAYAGRNITIEDVTFDGGAMGGITALTVDDITINGNAISSAGASSLTITPTAGQKLVLDGHWAFDGVAFTAETDANTTLTAYAGKNITIESVTFDGGVVAGIGSLTVDNILIDGNDISSTAGTDLTITPLAGQQIVLDSTIIIDAGVVTGATSISSTAFVGTLSTAAQPNVTSLGTLTTLTVDNIIINGNDISSSAGDITITPVAGSDVVLDGHFEFDGPLLTAITDNDTVIAAYAGKNINIESVTFDGGVVGGVSALVSTGVIEDKYNYDFTVTGTVGGADISSIAIPDNSGVIIEAFGAGLKGAAVSQFSGRWNVYRTTGTSTINVTLENPDGGDTGCYLTVVQDGNNIKIQAFADASTWAAVGWITIRSNNVLTIT